MADKPKVETLPLGWTTTVDSAGHVVLADDSGTARARWTHPPKSDAFIRRMARLPRGRTCQVEVVGVGAATINNGAPRPRRRHHSNGSIQIGARHYDVIHHRRRQTELLRDGTLVARFRARWGGRQQVMEDRSVDDIDRCAVGLVLAAMRVGRPGMLSSSLESIPLMG